MKLDTAIFLSLGLAASAAGLVYAAAAGSDKPDQSSMSNGMTNDTSEKNHQEGP